MQVFYQVAGGSGSYVLLYDEGAAAIDFDPKAITPGMMPRWEPEFDGVKQAEPIFTTPGGTVSRFRQALGNVECRVAAELHVGYRNRADALASVRVFAGLLQQLVHFKVVQDTETQFYPNAVVDSYHAAVNSGIDVTHTFNFSSDIVTATPP